MLVTSVSVWGRSFPVITIVKPWINCCLSRFVVGLVLVHFFNQHRQANSEKYLLCSEKWAVYYPDKFYKVRYYFKPHIGIALSTVRIMNARQATHDDGVLRWFISCQKYVKLHLKVFTASNRKRKQQFIILCRTELSLIASSFSDKKYFFRFTLLAFFIGNLWLFETY